MSTEFYALRPPVTCIRMEELGGHTHIGVWINHGKAGTLVVRNEEAKQTAYLMFNHDVAVALRTGDGLQTFFTLGDDQILMSEYGEVITWKELRS